MIRRLPTNLIVLVGYLAISFLYFALPLLSHPGRYLLAANQERDPELFVWSMAWWPHAIATWTNPFFTHAIYQPQGMNLMWATSVPGLAIAFSPVTFLFGPDVGFNVAALAMPALAAWTCYLLCRHLTGSVWASLVGGYLFGFSAYLLGHESSGHLHLTGVFLVPLVALVVVRYVQGELDGRGLLWRLGLLVAGQIWISGEITLTMTLVLALALVFAFALLPVARRRLVTAVPWIVAGYALATVLAAPIVYYTFAGLIPGSFTGPETFSGDLLNIVVPTRLTEIGGPWFRALSSHFPAYDNERGFYLGLPALAIVALFALRARRSPQARFLLAALLGTVVLTLGTALHINGHRSVALPWALFTHLPAFDNVLPVRFSMYVSLVVSVIVALWTASTRRLVLVGRYALPLLAVVSIAPAVFRVAYHQHPFRVSFFSDGTYRMCVPRNETLAIFPFGRWGDSMLWQAETGFRFRLAEGNMGRNNLPENFIADPIVYELQFKYIDPNIRPSMTQLLEYARTHHVDRFVAVVGYYPDGTQMHAFGSLQNFNGTLVAPACGYTSLTGDTRLTTPGQVDLRGRAPLAVVQDSEAALVKAHTLLAHANWQGAAAIVNGLEPDLRLVLAYHPTGSHLSSAVDLVARASQALASAAGGRQADDAIVRARRALAAYVASINPGLAQ